MRANGFSCYGEPNIVRQSYLCQHRDCRVPPKRGSQRFLYPVIASLSISEGVAILGLLRRFAPPATNYL